MSGRRFFRAASRFLAGTAILAVAAAAFAIFQMHRNPRVALGDPIVVGRAPADPREVTIVLGGDFAPTDAAMPFIRKYGYTYPYAATGGLLQRADIAFANLESPVTARDAPEYRFETYVYRTEPAAVSAFQWLGLDVVSVANNHALDQGVPGLLDTLRALDGGGIFHVGAGSSETEARRPVIFDIGGTKVGFIGYLENQLVFNLYFHDFAVGDRAGCAQLNAEDIAEDIGRLRPLVDLLIVSVHWGENYAPITRSQQELGRYIIEHGADVVAGHHPHVEQAIERHENGIIFYSLGNYAWGAPGHDDLRLGLLGRLHLVPRSDDRPVRLSRVEVIPLLTQNRIVQIQPRPLTRDETGLLTSWVQASSERGARLEVHVGDDGIVRADLGESALGPRQPASDHSAPALR
jgi:poly-gamma-glutamate synthesis protein (capsule biosynthesis protein)